jgi:HK97 family phage major capsid protein
MNVKEMRERINLLSGTLSTLGQKNDRTEDEERSLDTALAEFNDLAPKLERELAIEASAKRGAEFSQSRGRVSGQVPAGHEGRAQEQGEPTPIDRRSIGRRFAESEQIKAFNAAGSGARKSEAVSLRGISMDPQRTAVEYRDGDGPVEQRTLVYTGALPGYAIPDQVVPGIFRPRDYALTMRQVLMNGRTTSDTIYFLRELLYTNNAAETAQATTFDVTALGSSGRKPESALTFEQASAPVVTIAHWIPITRQALADMAQLQSYIEDRLLVGLERRLNSQVVTGDGTGANLTGILNTSGIQTADNAYFAGLATPLNDAGTPNEKFNRILDAMYTLIEVGAQSQATFIAMHPTNIEQIMTTTDGNRQYMGGGPFAAGGVRTLWGLPLVAERSITANHALVGDGTMAAIWDREDANILVDTINDQFVRNMLTILAELRAALTVFRPSAFVDVTLS